MCNNGVTHLSATDDMSGIRAVVHWLRYVPISRGAPLPLLPTTDPVDRDIDYVPTRQPYDPTFLVNGCQGPDGSWQTGPNPAPNSVLLTLLLNLSNCSNAFAILTNYCNCNPKPKPNDHLKPNPNPECHSDPDTRLLRYWLFHRDPQQLGEDRRHRRETPRTLTPISPTNIIPHFAKAYLTRTLTLTLLPTLAPIVTLTPIGP